jgi:hypothetical protein
MSFTVPRIGVDLLSPERFLNDFVATNQPVIVTGALESWNAATNWTPAALEELFKGTSVQVYNSYFDLKRLMPLNQYFEQYFGKDGPISGDGLPYVRWYTQLRDAKFFWADDAFSKFRDRWSPPAFMPGRDYVLPFAPGAKGSNPVTDPFPAKGLFISPRGAKTGLHVDPWGSCAVLCQLYGDKRWFFYAPDQAPYLTNGSELVDIRKPDRSKFPHFDLAKLTAECTLLPGEVMYVPHGWFHHVDSESDAISLTWNFVHRTTSAALDEWLSRPLSDLDLSVLRYFYSLDKEESDVVGKVRALIAA